MSVRVMHGLTMELRTVIDRVLSTCWKRAMVAMAKIKMVVNVAVEARRSMKPRPGSDKHAPGKPLRPVVAVRRTIVRRNFIVSVRTNRRRTNLYRNLCWSPIGRRKKQTGSNSRQTKILQQMHSVTSFGSKGNNGKWLFETPFAGAINNATGQKPVSNCTSAMLGPKR